MPIVQLPNGKELTYKNSVTGLEIAKDISISLSKKALALQVNGEYKDLDTEIVKDSKIKIISNKYPIPDHEPLKFWGSTNKMRSLSFKL